MARCGRPLRSFPVRFPPFLRPVPASREPVRRETRRPGKRNEQGLKPKSTFARFASQTARVTGNAQSFAIALAILAIWGLTGPIFGFSDTWQLVINTGTTIVTFLMVFLIQNTQNRDSETIQIKLDELIRAMDGAHNALLDLEELGDEELDLIRDEYEALAGEARKELAAREAKSVA